MTTMKPEEETTTMNAEEEGQKEQGFLASAEPILKQDSNQDLIPRRRKVSFDSVEIRYHAMELGDNPAVSIGAPVTLAWEAQGEETFDFESYELERSATRRKALRLLLLNYYKRQDILARAGYTLREITMASRDTAQRKRQREMTQMLGPLNRVDETVRKSMNIIFGCRSGAVRTVM